MYDIAQNKWSRAPDMNEPRLYHSSCALGPEMIYTFFGTSVNGHGYHARTLSSFERINAKTLLGWELISTVSWNQCVRYHPIVAALSKTEIVIFGGTDPNE